MTIVRSKSAGPVRLRRPGAWLGMLALLLQAVLPLSGMPLMQAAAGASPNISPICDIGAPRQGEQAPSGGGGGDRGATACPICQVLKQFGSFLPPVIGTAVTPVNLSAAGESPTGQALLSSRHCSTCRARAPPLSV